MNPILLKPKGEGCQVILKGKPYADVRKGRELDRAVLMEAVSSSFNELVSRNDVVVIEGSGSPAEINLRESDIANMATAEMANAPVILVGDIERGGVFAGLYGTFSLLEERHQKLVKAFLINRFRGDPSILGSGITKLEELMSVPCLGTLPFADLKFPGEDCLDLRRNQGSVLKGQDIRQAWLDNLDAFHTISQRHLDMKAIEGLALG
jgi:adenosylcobyric acid synthase